MKTAKVYSCSKVIYQLRENKSMGNTSIISGQQRHNRTLKCNKTTNDKRQTTMQHAYTCYYYKLK